MDIFQIVLTVIVSIAAWEFFKRQSDRKNNKER